MPAYVRGRACEIEARFGDSPALVLFDTPTEGVLVSPPHSAGAVAITISVAGDRSTPSTAAGDDFTYLAPRHHRHRHHRSRRCHRDGCAGGKARRDRGH